jgi:hypothetical protein
MAQVGEHLTSKCKVLNSIPSNTKKKGMYQTEDDAQICTGFGEQPWLWALLLLTKG